MPTTSTHDTAEPARTRKLLLHASEIRKLIGKVERAGYSLVPLNMHYSKGRVKLEVGRIYRDLYPQAAPPAFARAFDEYLIPTIGARYARG